MSDPFIGEMRIFGFNYAPRGWATCDGQLIPIKQNTALFSLLGITFGGDGRTNFGLPDLRGRVPAGAQSSRSDAGSTDGVESVMLTAAQIPSHTHVMTASSANASLQRVENAMVGNTNKSVLAKASVNMYGPPGTPQVLSPLSISSASGQVAHSNMQPYLVLTFCIALTGVFPPRP